MLNERMVIKHFDKVVHRLGTIYKHAGEFEDVRKLVDNCNEIIIERLGFRIYSRQPCRFKTVNSKVIRENCYELLELMYKIERSDCKDPRILKRVDDIIKCLEFIIIEC
jgi:hypothetical protein